MSHKISILWGETPDYGAEAKTYEFATKKELEAFCEGVTEAVGWADFTVSEEGYVYEGGEE